MFFGHCHRTRFRGSFCLASVFKMTVYLLTYLLWQTCRSLVTLTTRQWSPRRFQAGSRAVSSASLWLVSKHLPSLTQHTPCHYNTKNTQLKTARKLSPSHKFWSNVSISGTSPEVILLAIFFLLHLSIDIFEKKPVLPTIFLFLYHHKSTITIICGLNSYFSYMNICTNGKLCRQFG